MFGSDSALGARLRLHHVQVRTTDEGTVVLRNVPVNERCFNKARTNLLVKRPQHGLPCLIGVDEDLEYRGTDPSLARAFSGGTTQQGWRVVFVDSRVQADLGRVVEDALRAVGFDGVEPVWTAPPDATRSAGGLAARFGVDLSCADENTRPVSTVGRTETVAEVLSSILQLHPRLPLVAGNPGVGKSHLLQAVADRLRASRPDWRVIRIDLGHLFAGTMFDAEREHLLEAVLNEVACREGHVLALERIDLTLTGTRHGGLELGRAVDAGGRLVGTTLPSFLPLFEVAPFWRHVHVVRLDALSPAEARDVVRAALPALSVHHQVQIDDAAVATAVDCARTLSGHLPATALALIDAACARARLSGVATVDPSIVYVAACGFSEDEEPHP